MSRPLYCCIVSRYVFTAILKMSGSAHLRSDSGSYEAIFEDVFTGEKRKIQLQAPHIAIGSHALVSKACCCSKFEDEEFRERSSDEYTLCVKEYFAQPGIPSHPDFQSQLWTLLQLSHEALVKFDAFGYLLSRNMKKFALLAEYFEGMTLKEYYSGNRFDLNGEYEESMAYQMLSGVEYLHSEKVLYGDISPYNTLVAKSGPEIQLKIIDFDSSVVLEQKWSTKMDMKDPFGTEQFSSPELLCYQLELCFSKRKTHHIGRASDMWSFACLLIYMWNGGSIQFEQENGVCVDYFPTDRITDVTSGKLKPAIPAFMSAFWQRVARQCLLSKPDQRPRSQRLLVEVHNQIGKKAGKNSNNILTDVLHKLPCLGIGGIIESNNKLYEMQIVENGLLAVRSAKTGHIRLARYQFSTVKCKLNGSESYLFAQPEGNSLTIYPAENFPSHWKLRQKSRLVLTDHGEVDFYLAPGIRICSCPWPRTNTDRLKLGQRLCGSSVLESNNRRHQVDLFDDIIFPGLWGEHRSWEGICKNLSRYSFEDWEVKEYSPPEEKVALLQLHDNGYLCVYSANRRLLWRRHCLDYKNECGSFEVTTTEIKNAFSENGSKEPTNDQCDYIQHYAGGCGSIFLKRDLAMFLAHVILETDGLKYTEELNEPENGIYQEDRCNLGRGYLHIRGRKTYEKASRALFPDGKVRLDEQPELIANDEDIAWRTAFWWWDKAVHRRRGRVCSRFKDSVEALYPGIPAILPGSNWKRIDPTRRFKIYETVCRAFAIPEHCVIY